MRSDTFPKSLRLVPAILVALALPAVVSPVLAQQAAPLGGQAVPGICLLSREAVFANAAAGKAATARLQQLAQAAQAEIDGRRAPLETEAKALEGQPDSPQVRQRRTQVAERWQALQRDAAHGGREIEATRAAAMRKLADAAQPLIADAYGQKKCGLLLDRAAVLGGNMANDLTTDVVRALDARMPTMAFERERLPQPAAGPAQGAR
ncbi:OmpH family outer membrane protein [Sandaracinobacter sp. RS1-74]|uniref:OmpH family outer membrane protein n=1 Tax=Sandaracinobacteroides sayramensis TaxID=2913411 RepID=UPI001EDA7DC3|nr:OmpH family outer membrane protein [Sandaracinobacteroides sayramensis]MCG2839423.1 OmpH family outer membrane protein [Sandaracinobacteroides sayramensis]